MINPPRAALAILSVSAALVTAPANASVLIDVEQLGTEVIVHAGGSLNLSGATQPTLYPTYGSYGVGVVPGGADWYIAPGAGGAVQVYDLTGVDVPFGSDVNFLTASSFGGANFFIWGAFDQPQVGVPLGYVSGSPISSDMFFYDNAISGLTLIPGTYTFTLPSDSITLDISGVPEPGTLALLGTGLLGLGMSYRRRARKQVPAELNLY